jgi:hypothetical protein
MSFTYSFPAIITQAPSIAIPYENSEAEGKVHFPLLLEMF